MCLLVGSRRIVQRKEFSLSRLKYSLYQAGGWPKRVLQMVVLTFGVCVAMDRAIRKAIPAMVDDPALRALKYMNPSLSGRRWAGIVFQSGSAGKQGNGRVHRENGHASSLTKVVF